MNQMGKIIQWPKGKVQQRSTNTTKKTEHWTTQATYNREWTQGLNLLMDNWICFGDFSVFINHLTVGFVCLLHGYRLVSDERDWYLYYRILHFPQITSPSLTLCKYVLNTYARRCTIPSRYLRSLNM